MRHGGQPGGWHLVPHLPAPASLLQLAEHCHRLTTHCPAWIVPYVSGTGHAGNYDVMRGEEVQFFGAQQLPHSEHKAPQLLCFPGTHNKWIDASSSTLNNFSTTMSGSCLGYSANYPYWPVPDGDAPWNDDAFTQGLDHAKQPGGLLHHLFVCAR